MRHYLRLALALVVSIMYGNEAGANKPIPYDRIIGDQQFDGSMKPYFGDRIVGDRIVEGPIWRDPATVIEPIAVGPKDDFGVPVVEAYLNPVKTTPGKVALVIGNGRYTYASQLKNPPADANAIAKRLSELGMNVVTAIDANKPSFEKAVREFLGKLDDSSVALLFYAGHGLQVDGRNYLVPVDAKIEDRLALDFELVALDSLVEMMASRSEATVVILDSCRDNPLSRSLSNKKGETRSLVVGRGMAQLDAPLKGTIIVYATQPGNVALDGEGDHSPFTGALLSVLQTPDADVESLMKRVKAKVVKATNDRQRPWVSSDVIGDVYLSGEQ